MTIYSLEIILTFLLVILLSWVLPKKQQMLSSAFITVLFLAYFDVVSLWILLVICIISYQIPQKYTFSTKVLLYLIFVISLIFIISKTLALLDSSEYILPLGLSFYSFRAIHYIFEGYKEKLPKHTFYDYFIYLFFLPTFIVGPINRFQQFHKDLKSRKFNKISISLGLERILYGYAKIVILSSYFLEEKLTIYISGIGENHNFIYHYLGSLQYWLNLYFQFSGYSDIAIGISSLMGFKIMENFNYPFFAKNISEFWKRWHISLSKWIKDYVYMPLVSLTRRAFFSVLISLIIFGLWHEFSFNYILWGFYHAFGVTVWHKFQVLKNKNPYIEEITKYRMFTVFSVLLTFHFVVFSFEVRTVLLRIFY